MLSTQYAKGVSRSPRVIKVWDIYNIFYAEIKCDSFQRTEKSAGLTKKKNREKHLGKLHYENKIYMQLYF